MKTAYLILQDGSIYSGESLGSEGRTFGEVVFNTSMTGYQEMLSDPSYAGQILIPTYPLVGNYGINDQNSESNKAQVAGFVIREECTSPSHHDSVASLRDFLYDNAIVGISGVDTRAITRRIRSYGVMMGMVTTNETPDEGLALLRSHPSYEHINYVNIVTTKSQYKWSGGDNSSGPRVVVVDCGVKYNILRILSDLGCHVDVLPASADPKTIFELQPDGVVFSPGPGDPVHNEVTVNTAKALFGKIPLLGICLGHQIIAQAAGAKTYKLKFGHRGGNHPVQDLYTGRVHVSAQNHGYTVDEKSLPPDLAVSHRSLNDGTVEGLRHHSAPIITIQYHSEASPGPLDNAYIFDEFLSMMRNSS